MAILANRLTTSFDIGVFIPRDGRD